ncbi:MAG TPA: prepilin-type N-terminal cleavage/methylation domain-containing protein [bacterium]|nr:prepilin-type N-terminal cleavage/methylation domain-containing protein [bacterium]HQL63547.1 prepilin-type N-terminal cleavage/methylation domain-containing protein [bacterium]
MVRKGFTLIELLIVVAIIGILAAIAVPNFLNAQIRAKASKVHADFRSLATAIESYRLEFGNYMPYPEWGSHTAPRYLAALSTPVAFISSAESFQDPFRKKSEADRDGEAAPRYGYFDPHDQQWIMDDAKFRGYNLNPYQWCLVSPGPDYEQQLDGGKRPGYYPYDASNGLNSFGDILRVGP